MFTRTYNVYPALKEATGGVYLRGEQNNGGLLCSTSCGRSCQPQTVARVAHFASPIGKDWPLAIDPGS